MWNLKAWKFEIRRSPRDEYIRYRFSTNSQISTVTSDRGYRVGVAHHCVAATARFGSRNITRIEGLLVLSISLNLNFTIHIIENQKKKLLSGPHFSAVTLYVMLTYHGSREFVSFTETLGYSSNGVINDWNDEGKATFHYKLSESRDYLSKPNLCTMISTEYPSTCMFHPSP